MNYEQAYLYLFNRLTDLERRLAGIGMPELPTLIEQIRLYQCSAEDIIIAD